MRKIWALGPAVLLAVMLVTTGCVPGPCDSLPRPSQVEIDTNPDIERSVNGTECDFEDGAWAPDNDVEGARTATRTPEPTRSTSRTRSSTRTR